VAWLTVVPGSAMGLNLVFLHQAPHESKLWPLVFARLSATAVVFAMAAMSKNLRLPRGKPLKLALGVALLDICANVTMLLALHTWLLSLASILISLYPAATVVLAMVVPRERVSRVPRGRHGDGHGLRGDDRRKLGAATRLSIVPVAGITSGS
jgi:drug/metabolite transporter (DMT)-like permease